jgi:hypothetical protein
MTGVDDHQHRLPVPDARGDLDRSAGDVIGDRVVRSIEESWPCPATVPAGCPATPASPVGFRNADQ